MTELIPAIDIIDGKCVRLIQGAYDKKTVYSVQPVDVALEFESMGIRRLHLVDLDGARQGRVVNLDMLSKISTETDLIIDFGGGIKTDSDIRKVFENGAEMATAGSIAFRDRSMVEKWIQEFGPAKIILGADVRNGMIAINAWMENTDMQYLDFVKAYEQSGLKKVVCTDISRDGMLGGPAFDLYLELRETFPAMEIIASGGVSDMRDIIKLSEMGLDGVIFGKAFYEGRINADEIMEYTKKG